MTERKGLINFSILIIFFNLIFIGLAFYREQVQNQWMNDLIRPDTALSKLQQLTSYSNAIPFIYSMTILALGISFMLKRSNHLQSFILKKRSPCVLFPSFRYAIGRCNRYCSH